MSDIVSRSPPLGVDDTATDAQPRSEAAAVAAQPERKPRIVIVGAVLAASLQRGRCGGAMPKSF